MTVTILKLIIALLIPPHAVSPANGVSAESQDKGVC